MKYRCSIRGVTACPLSILLRMAGFSCNARSSRGVGFIMVTGLRSRGCSRPSVSIDVLQCNTSPFSSMRSLVRLTVELFTPKSPAICLSLFSGVAFNCSRMSSLRCSCGGGVPFLFLLRMARQKKEGGFLFFLGGF